MDADLYQRWTKNERWQHWILALTFVVLLITGFALKYPESWWTWPFIVTGAVDLRGFLHRLAATCYLALGLYHLLYLTFSRRGRQQFRALILRGRDFKDMVLRLRANLGKAAQLPAYGHFTYWEKFEYWALVWGTVIMALTGLALWFENLSLKIFPLWMLDVATVIHFYEAILASLAILVWHFYFVIVDPAVYPANFSMFTGYLTREEMAREHMLELTALEQEASPQAPAVTRATGGAESPP